LKIELHILSQTHSRIFPQLIILSCNSFRLLNTLIFLLQPFSHTSTWAFLVGSVPHSTASSVDEQEGSHSRHTTKANVRTVHFHSSFSIPPFLHCSIGGAVVVDSSNGSRAVVVVWSSVAVVVEFVSRMNGPTFFTSNCRLFLCSDLCCRLFVGAFASVRGVYLA
jgi:hypothetical protein